jgi:hypothetical protein
VNEADGAILKGMAKLFKRLEQARLTDAEREFVARAKRPWEMNANFELNDAIELEKLLTREGISLWKP